MKRMTIDIMCSACGYHEKLSNEKIDDSVDVIKRGWGSCGSALYCPECTKAWSDRNGNRKMADERNTFVLIMRLFFDAINDAKEKPKKETVRKRRL